MQNQCNKTYVLRKVKKTKDKKTKDKKTTKRIARGTTDPGIASIT